MNKDAKEVNDTTLRFISSLNFSQSDITAGMLNAILIFMENSTEYLEPLDIDPIRDQIIDIPLGDFAEDIDDN